jgi:glycine oxidase
VRATVIGAGVAGLACAVELAERGVAVEVVEVGAALGAGCSRHAGGMLAPWCERESAEPVVARLGEESIGWWASRFRGTVRRGSLVLAHGRDAGELRAFARKTERYDWVDREQIAALEPDLAGRFNSGLYFESEAHLDPRAALTALAARLAERGGTIRFGADGGDGADGGEAATAHHERGATGCVAVEHVVIDCRGLAARDVLTDLRGVKGEMLLLRQPELSLSRPVRILHPRIPVYVVPRGNGLFMVGATMIESDDASRVTARSVLELLSAAYALHPAFGEAEIIEMATGVRPAFPDNLPRIRWRDGVLHINGLYRHGFLLAPALARIAADGVLEGRWDPEVMDEDHPQRRRA